MLTQVQKELTMVPPSLFFTCMLSLLLLIGCGEAKKSDHVNSASQITTAIPIQASINLMLATAPEDEYFASIQSGNKTLSLFTQNATSVALIYNDDDYQVIRWKKGSDTFYAINDYIFEYQILGDTAEIIVTNPIHQRESYYVNADGTLIQGRTEEGDTKSVTSCIAKTQKSSYCMNLDPLLYPESYCSVDYLNKSAGGNGIITSVSYSSTALCAIRSYPYNLTSSNSQGWSAWYDSPIVDSAPLTDSPTPALFKETPFDTSTCHREMHQDNSSWRQCVNQQTQALFDQTKADSSDNFRHVVQAYYPQLLSAFDNAVAFVKRVKTQCEFDNVLVNKKSYYELEIVDFSALIHLGNTQLFNDLNNDMLKDNYPGLGNIVDKIWEAPREQLGNEVTLSNEIIVSCIVKSPEMDYCIDLDIARYPANNCTLEAFNNEGDYQESSSSYSTTQRCANRGYPYNVAHNNIKGWSEWFMTPVKSDVTADIIKCRVSSDSNEFSYINEGIKLQCTGEDHIGREQFLLQEEIGIAKMGPSFSENDRLVIHELTTFNLTDDKYQTDTYLEVKNPNNAAYTLKREHREYSRYSQLMSIERASYNVPYEHIKLIDIYQWSDQSYHNESCTEDASTDNIIIKHHKDKNGQVITPDNCPFEISPNVTLRIHNISKAEIWLLNNEYERYLSD